jgi:hypothetical protein
MNEHLTTRAAYAQKSRRGTWLIAIATAFFALRAVHTLAQESKPSPQPAAQSDTQAPGENPVEPDKRAAPAPDSIRYVGPDVYILLDAAGRPQPMPGMAYEDFLAAWKQLNQEKSSDNKPSFTIESIRFTGNTRGQRAELDFEATVLLLGDGPADVSLGLVGAVLQGKPTFSGDASNRSIADGVVTAAKTNEEYLTYDPDRGGFTARVDGTSGERRNVAFHIIVPLTHDGAETTLPINCPKALSAQLDVTVDTATSDVRAVGGVVTRQESTSDGGTRISVAGPAGLFRLAWQTASADAPAMTSILNAFGAIHVTIDGRGIRSDARLTVRSFGGSFDQFRVRLPVGAQLIPFRTDTMSGTEAKYRVRVEPDNTPGASKESRRQIAIIELAEKQQGPVVVDLSTELAGAPTDPGQETNLAGFEVIGAIRQFGDVALNIADDWQARWNFGSSVRQVDPGDLDSILQTYNPTAAFQFDRQPWALKVRTTRRQLRVNAVPNFKLECLQDETRLNMRVAYQVYGARAMEFRVELNGWETTGDEIESGGLVDQDRVEVTRDGILVLPLAQASSRRAEIALSLRRPALHDNSRLEIPLPVPIADSVGTGELSVRAAPDLELLPDLSSSIGIAATAGVATADEPADSTGAELHYRTLQPAVTFVADRTNRAREVVTQSVAQIEFDEEFATIDQRVDYTVRYEPVTELIYEVPNDLSPETQNLEFQLLTASSGSGKAEEATPLHVTVGDDEYAAGSQAGSQQIRIMLPQPHIGRFAVRIRYRQPQPTLSATDVLWMMPMIHPADSRDNSNQVALHAPRGLTVALETDASETSWKAATTQGENTSLNSIQNYSTDAAELYLPLTVRYGRSDNSSPLTVERVWVQAWFANDVRQDRAAFRFRTNGNQATVELPPETVSNEIEVLVDRQPAEVLSRASGRLVVRLPQPRPASEVEIAASASEHTLELRSRQSVRKSLLTRHHLTPPQIEGMTALSQVYWQIVLPADEDVVAEPQQLISASKWQWLGSFWGLAPVATQPDLERWTNSSEQPPPPESQTQYLYTGLLPVSSIELVTAPRWLLVLGASAAVLAAALAWMYVPAAQRLWILGAVALLLVGVTITYPAAALLLAQASLLGLILSVVALVLRKIFARTSRPSLSHRVSPSSQRIIPPRSESVLMQPIMTAASTAPTASLRLSDSEG